MTGMWGSTKGWWSRRSRKKEYYFVLWQGTDRRAYCSSKCRIFGSFWKGRTGGSHLSNYKQTLRLSESHFAVYLTTAPIALYLIRIQPVPTWVERLFGCRGQHDPLSDDPNP
jgi:hypothetical protein